MDKRERVLQGGLFFSFSTCNSKEHIKLLLFQIMVMIGVVFRDALLKRYINEEEVSLIILDECHHCKKNSPYAQVVIFGSR
jgi:ERCC4-related helicase